MISMIAGEADANELADRLEAEEVRLCSAISVWETVAGLCRTYRFPVAEARILVASFVTDHGFQFASIGEREFAAAIDAYARFGRGRHPAALNMGDCYAYACAATNNARLLFKGDDFPRTDVTR